MIDQKKGNKNLTEVQHLPNIWLTLGFYGGVYPKFGMNRPK